MIAGGCRVAFKRHGGGVDEVCEGYFIGRSQGDAASALTTGLAAAKLLGEGGTVGACRPEKVRRRAERIGTWLGGVGGQLNARAFRQRIGGSGDGVPGVFACQVGGCAVCGDDLVARHEQRCCRKFKQRRGSRGGAVSFDEEGRGFTGTAPLHSTQGGEDRVTCRFGVCAAFEDEGSGRVACVRRTEFCERSGGDRFSREVCGGDDGHIETPGAQGVAGDIEGRQTGDAFGRDGKALSAQVFRRGDAVGRHVGHGTEHGGSLQGRRDAVLRSGVFG